MFRVVAAGVALTYMTGTLFRIGHLLAAALLGGPRWAWIPNFLLWSAMVIGAAVGTSAYMHFNLTTVWPGAGVALLVGTVVALSAWREPVHRR